jgi:putative ABC transport system ATP-binding protein
MGGVESRGGAFTPLCTRDPTLRSVLQFHRWPCYTSYMIRLERVSKQYHDGQQDVWALREIDLSIPKGQVVALIGKSGSGKSTLLHLIGGLDLPTDGAITVASARLDSLRENQRTEFRLRHVGLVFQFFHLLPGLTVVENVMFPAELAGISRKEARLRSERLLERVDLGQRANSFPDRLSGGEQQRVAIARGLILQPQILLADEPTGNLDTESGDRVARLLLDLARDHQTTLLLATHSQELAARTDRVVTLSGGRIVADSGPKTDGIRKEGIPGGGM